MAPVHAARDPLLLPFDIVPAPLYHHLAPALALTPFALVHGRLLRIGNIGAQF